MKAQGYASIAALALMITVWLAIEVYAPGPQTWQALLVPGAAVVTIRCTIQASVLKIAAAIHEALAERDRLERQR